MKNKNRRPRFNVYKRNVTYCCVTKQDENMPSGEILLSTTLKEYDYEAERKKGIVTRTGVLIAFIGVLLGFYIKEFDFSIISKAKTNVELLFFIIITVIYAIPIIMVIISLKNFINVFKAKEYKRVDLSNFNKASAQRDKGFISFNLVVTYKKVLDHNIKANNSAVLQFNKGINTLYISMLIMVFIYIIKELTLSLL